MATTLAARPFYLHRAQRLTWRRPEWPWVLLAGSAWSILIVEELRPEAGKPVAGHPMNHPMAPGMSMSTPGPGAHSHHHYDLSAAAMGWWMLMIVAMMVPAALPLVREISFQSIWARRYRSAAIFLAGYLAVWAVIGAAVLGIWSLVLGSSSSAAALGTGVALLAAAGWGLTTAKRRFLKRCHRYVPLAPRGRAGDRACLRFGVYHARQCVGVCWPVMLAMVPGHALVGMICMTALVTWERLARLPRLRVGALLLATAGTVVVVAAL